MLIDELTTSELKRILRDTEELLGRGAIEVRMLQRELTRRTDSGSAREPAQGRGKT